MNATKTDLTVANTILEQLGGKLFAVMTGVKKAFGTNNSLQFTLPRIVNGINHVKIELTPQDDYKVIFAKNSKHNFVVVKTLDGIYADQLQEIFTETTGLYTTL